MSLPSAASTIVRLVIGIVIVAIVCSFLSLGTYLLLVLAGAALIIAGGFAVGVVLAVLTDIQNCNAHRRR